MYYLLTRIYSIRDKPSTKLVIAIYRTHSEKIVVGATKCFLGASSIDKTLAYVVFVWYCVFYPFFQVFAVVVY
jgi:hypothetical protein